MFRLDGQAADFVSSLLYLHTLCRVHVPDLLLVLSVADPFRSSFASYQTSPVMSIPHPDMSVKVRVFRALLLSTADHISYHAMRSCEQLFHVNVAATQRVR